MDDARYVVRAEFFTAVNYVIKHDESNEHETSPRRRHKLPGEK